MDVQQLVIERFRESVHNTKSFTQHLADILDISYDAAYRRQTGKAKLEIGEAITLAQTGQFSLDDLLLSDAPLTALGKATNRINTMEELTAYFKNMHVQFSLLGPKNVEFAYSAKDIPLYHHLSRSTLTRFKVYAWLHMLQLEQQYEPFANFHLSLDLKAAMETADTLFKKYKITEVWNDTTVSSSLKQIHYFYTAGMLDLPTALILCDEVKSLIKDAQERLKEPDYNIYFHELLIMTNNSIAYKNDKPVAGFVTMTMLGYIQFTATDMLERMDQYHKHQLRQATSLSHVSSKDKALFFNKLIQRIEALRQSLKPYDVML